MTDCDKHGSDCCGHHQFQEGNRMHGRTIYYSNIQCAECKQKFEHIIGYGPGGNQVTTMEINELQSKKLSDFDYDDGIFPK